MIKMNEHGHVCPSKAGDEENNGDSWATSGGGMLVEHGLTKRVLFQKIKVIHCI